MPIIEPVKENKFDLKVETPKMHNDMEFMKSLFKTPERMRNIAVIGSLHSGKTSFMDMMYYSSHDVK